jgi:hypothetical protein
MIQRNKKSYANGILLLAITICILLTGCGRTSPSPYWTWSKEDSTAIQGIVNTWQDTFATSFEDTFYMIGFRSDTLRKILVADMNSIWMRPHYWPHAFKREITSYQMIDSFIPVKDTTIMVRLTENFHGKVIIKADSCTLRDPLRPDTVVGSDTLPLFSRFFYYTPDTVVENNFDGYSTRYLHFDKKDGSWKLRKMSGGARIFIPDENSAPYLGLCSLKTRVKSYGILLRPDTTHYGIQRLYDLDSIMNFPSTDTFTVRVMSFDPLITFGFLHYKQHRYDLETATPSTFLKTYPITLSSGWNQIMVELVPWEALCKQTDYNALFWAIPMKIVP